MNDFEAKFWLVFALFILVMAVSTSSTAKKAGSKTHPSVFVTRGAVELLFTVLLLIMFGDELEWYWDRFELDRIGDFLDLSVECFLGGIMVVGFGIGGIVDLVRGLGKKS